jgi:hypothetical protein
LITVEWIKPNKKEPIMEYQNALIKEYGIERTRIWKIGSKALRNNCN